MRIRLLVLSILLLVVAHNGYGQIITTVAGVVGGSSVDGIPATDASIGYVGSIVFDDLGNYYFGSNQYKIRKVSPDGVINTVAGNGSNGFAGDGGAATNAQISLVGAFAFDKAGNLYIPDISNNRIRRVDKVTGVITTIAGTGAPDFGGDGGPALSAKLFQPWAITFDSDGNLYFADGGNYRIRKIDLGGNISTIAGVGIPGFTGDGGPASAAKLEGLERIYVDNYNSMYITQTNVVRKMNLNTGIITRVAGTGISGYNGDGGDATSTMLNGAVDIIPDELGNFYVSEEYNYIIRQVDSSGKIKTIAGNNIAGYSGDNVPATSTRLNYPRGIALDICNNLFIADAGNGRIRKVTFNPPPCDHLGVVGETTPVNILINPNPVTETMLINNINTQTNFRLFNLVGTSMQQGSLRQGNNSINVSTLPAGIYLLELTDEEGKRTVTKIIKQ